MKKINMYENNKGKGIFLNANELYKNLNSEILDEIQSSIKSISFNRYPDNESYELREKYASVYNLSGDEIIAGNGSDEMLGLMINIFLGKGKILYTLEPDFSMYKYYASMQEAEVLGFKTKEDGSFNIDNFIKEGKCKKVNLILFSNPNNPTGHQISNADIVKILKAFSGIPVIIDEAYVEYARENVVELISKYKNLYVTRTLSKAFALAAARVGFLISNRENIRLINSKKVPYNVNSISQRVATIVLSHAEEFKNIVEEVRDERDLLFKICKNSDVYTIYPSQANFIYGRSPYKNKLLNILKQNGIVIRDFQDDTFRITIGSKDENKILRDILLNFKVEVKEHERI